LKEHVQTKVKERHKLQDTKKQERARKSEESKKAFDAWKSCKNELLRTTKTQFSYKNQSKIHSKAWCPARRMEHGYPKDPRAPTPGKRPSTRTGVIGSRPPSAVSYESDSFESSSTTESESIDQSIVDSETENDKIGCTGRKKTIQVCCKTLEYWCTCNDQT